MSLIDWIGSVGVFIILLAYFLNVTQIIKNTSLLFILMNLFGAVLACVASALIDYLPFVILEATWAAVSAYSLVQSMIVRYRKRIG